MTNHGTSALPNDGLTLRGPLSMGPIRATCASLIPCMQRLTRLRAYNARRFYACPYGQLPSVLVHIRLVCVTSLLNRPLHCCLMLCVLHDMCVRVYIDRPARPLCLLVIPGFKEVEIYRWAIYIIRPYTMIK